MIAKSLASTIDHICNIIEAAKEEEYSQRGSYDYSRRNSYDNGNMGGRGGSYARNRQRRDSRGRYSGEYGYSRTEGVEDMLENVREMMQELPPDVQKDAQRFIQKLEQQM